MTLNFKALIIFVAIWLSVTVCCFADSPDPLPGSVLPQSVKLGNDKQPTTSATQSNPKLGNKSSSSSKAPVKTGAERILKITAKGRLYTLSQVLMVDDQEYLVAVQDEGLNSLAKAFNTSLSWEDRKVVAKRGSSKYTLNVGQKKMPAELGGRTLETACQVLNGKPYIPLVAAGDLCGVCISVNADGKTGVASAAITDVHMEWDGDKQRMVIKSQHPVSFKTFTLKKPDRYVIDLSGGALNVENKNIYHPRLGVIRLAQNSLSPAVTRVVIPMVAGYKIVDPRRNSGTEFVFGFNDDNSYTELPSVNYAEQRLTRCQVEERGDKSVVHLSLSGPVRFEWARLIAPDYRFFVDLPNVILAGAKQEMRVRNAGVRSVRVSQNSHNPPKTRVVLDMQKPQAVEVKAGADGMSVDITIDSRTVPANSTMITGSGFTNGSGTVSAPSSGAAPIVVYQPTSVNPNGQVRTVCIDPGHGGADSGAYNRVLNIAEEDVTLDVSMRLTDLLRRSGWKVVMTREDDRDVSYAGSSDSEELWARAKAGNECGADVFVSIHCNSAASSSAEGTSIHVYKQGDITLGNVMIGPLITHTGRRNRGVKEDRFYVLAHTKMPAVLVELAFLSNHEEGRLLADPAFRQRVAEGLAEGLNNYAGTYMQGSKAAPVISAPAPSRPSVIQALPSRTTTIQSAPSSSPQTYRERRRQSDSDAVLPHSVL